MLCVLIILCISVWFFFVARLVKIFRVMVAMVTLADGNNYSIADRVTAGATGPTIVKIMQVGLAKLLVV